MTPSSVLQAIPGAPAMISIEVPGRPIAFARAGRNGKRSYTPQEQERYMMELGLRAKRAMSAAGYAPFEGPLELQYRATFNWPERWSQAKKDRTWLKTSKPDLDNTIKIAGDALNKIAYLDDAQICSIVAQKRYGPLEGVVITVACLDKPQSEDALSPGDLAKRYPAPEASGGVDDKS